MNMVFSALAVWMLGALLSVGAMAQLANPTPIAPLPTPCPTVAVSGPINAAANSALQLVERWVDPVLGDDTLALTGNSAFRTIQAACSALVPFAAQAQLTGRINLLPGRYGYGVAGNGEVWPVVVPPNISLVGVNALSVILDGALASNSSVPMVIPDPRTGISAARRPLLVFNSGNFDQTLVARVTLNAATLGVLVTGTTACNPLFSNVCFSRCNIGVQLHSTGSSADGLHRPRFLHCTFGGCNVGLAATGTTNLLSGGAAARALPAVVNSLFRNTYDMEGIACQSVMASAFDPARCNTSTVITQPVVGTSIVASWAAYSLSDLFLGAVTWPASAGPYAFSDWRLTYRTVNNSANPAIAMGISIFPLQTSNGTLIDLGLAAYAGVNNGTGAGSGGYLPGAGGWDLGFEPVAGFCVGGTMPLSDGFGQAASGTPFADMHFFFAAPAPLNWLFAGVPMTGGPSYAAGSIAPAGMLEAPLPLTSTLNAGGWWLDFGVPLFDISALLNGSNAGSLNGGAHWVVPLNPAGLGAPLHMVLQGVQLSATGTLQVTNAAYTFITP